MSQDPPPLDQALFEAMQKTGAERDRYLHEIPGADPAYRDELNSLLSAAEGMEGFLENKTVSSEQSSILEGSTIELGDRIGSYRLDRILGRGGMGTVYLASRMEGDFHQQVAVKLLHPGQNSAEVLGRFRQERQVLASLEHPNIARLIDGGEAEGGRPFLVMERVDGMRIDRYCEENTLTLPKRLELFRTVCAAVHFAHQNLVVHRDLKPSNILVDKSGHVKLLDFGISKVLEDPGQGQTDNDQTKTLDRRLTPQYASPEQILNSPITTSSDVYSLGVILFVLLCGELPFQGSTSKSPVSLETQVLETEPPKPSDTVLASDSTARRKSRLLAGDLDNIVLKALRKDTTQRYASAEALAEDLERFLTGQPVLARVDTPLYRFTKFIQRNPVAVLLSAVLVLVLLIAALINTISAKLISVSFVVVALAGIAGATLLVRAKRAQRDAERNRRSAEQVTEYLEDALRSIRPDIARGKDSELLRGILDATARRISFDLVEDSPPVASLLLTIGSTYRSLGLLDDAERFTERSVRVARSIFGRSDIRVAEYLCELGEIYQRRGRSTPALSAFEEALRLLRKDKIPSPHILGDVLAGIGSVCEAVDHVDRAVANYREALRVREEAFGKSSREYVSSLNNLGWVLTQQDQPEEAEELLQSSVKLSHQIGDEGVTANSLASLGAFMNWQGRYVDAEALYRESLECGRRLFGADHLQHAERMGPLATALERKTPPDYKEAEQLYRESLRILTSAYGHDHREVATAMNNLGGVLSRQKRWEEAESAFRESITIYRQALGPEHSWVAIALGNLATTLLERGKTTEAVGVSEECLALRRSTWPDSYWRVADGQSILAGALSEASERSRAEQLHRQAISTLEASLRADHPVIARAKLRWKNHLSKFGTAT